VKNLDKEIVKEFIIFAALAITIATVLHHVSICGRLIDIDDVLHHESILTACLFLIFGIYIGDYLSKLK
jgi:hypothetical protein